MKYLLLPLATALACLFAISASADPRYVGETFRVTGTLDAGAFLAQRIQLREQDSDKAQVAGAASEVDAGARALRIGPVRVVWSAATRFEDIEEGAIADGRVLRASGKMDADGVLRATRIDVPSSNWVVGTFQLTATVASSRALGARGQEVTMMNVPVLLPRAGFNRDDSLTRRQDSRRPELPFTIDLGGHPLRITGEYEMNLRHRRNFTLDDSGGAQVRDDISHEFQLEFFLPWSDRVYFFAEAEASYENEFHRSDGNGDSEGALARGQSWVYVDGLAGNRIGLHIGRQNLRETREWWWDDDLDAARIVFDEGPLHAYAGVARELAKVASRDDGIDPAQEDVLRVFGSASWLWNARESVELFALHQNDGSSRPEVGESVRDTRQDESDADLTWVGMRALGQRGLDEYGLLRYWADFAYVRGDELALEFDDDVVASRAKRDVRGYGIDLGASWRTALPGAPSFTLAFARGSGDGDLDDGDDRSFRQSGLQGNKWRFHGVSRFRYYGEVLRPELSNLDIYTAAAGMRFWRNSSAELVYHHYRQVEPADSLRDVRVDADLDGAHRHVGDGIDLVVGIREGRHADLVLTAGWFRSGKAYGELAGESVWLFNAEFVFFF